MFTISLLTNVPGCATHEATRSAARAWYVAGDRYEIVPYTVRDGVVVVLAAVTLGAITLEVKVVAEFVVANARDKCGVVLWGCSWYVKVQALLTLIYGYLADWNFIFLWQQKLEVWYLLAGNSHVLVSLERRHGWSAVFAPIRSVGWSWLIAVAVGGWFCVQVFT